MTSRIPAQSPSREERLRRLGLYGLLAHLEELREESWVERLIEIEEEEKAKRSLERRLRNARIRRFKPITDFDWTWPKKIDRPLFEDLWTLGFLEEATNVIFFGPNGVGKTTLAKNLAHRALLEGHTVRFGTASEMLNDLAAQEGTTSLARRLRRYTSPALLVIDEVGYLSYDSRHADLLFEIVSRREGECSTIITTNRRFEEWAEFLPGASCVTALVDRLVHRSELLSIEADCSYRLKESQEQRKKRSSQRRAKKKPRAKS